MTLIQYIDSHTGGEPTRVVFSGTPDLGTGSMAERLEAMKSGHDWLRRALILEPRGCDWLVGAVLQEPIDSTCAAGVLFFNNAGYLGMCGHGLIGVVETLAHLERIGPGEHRFETPVGIVSAVLHDDRSVSINNVVSYRYRQDVVVDVPGEDQVTGDIAWGGNWFFLVSGEDVDRTNIDALLARSRRIMLALADQQITGSDGGRIDHVELFGKPSDKAKADSRSFVLCPGGEYDRSPCGTGTSAKLACLAADEKLAPGDVWRQESIVGSVFEGRYQVAAGGIVPTIRGRAYVTAETKCVISEDDPFRFGVRMVSNE
ncbi:MAG: 4-hydroxyproline epimerase [Rhodopirellula sp.]|nr:4-hydroxyproline epimerase [Rhodopirellula sp.]